MKAWLYYRLSRDEDEEMNSLQNQRQILIDYAKHNDYTVVGESFDDNVSGMTFDRKGLNELENAVEEGKVEAVLVKDLSRLGRHRTQTALFIDHLRENNVKVISVTEGIERRLATLKKHLEQADIYFKCKGKKPLTEAEQILFTTAKDYLKGIMNGKTTIPTKTWKEEYTKLTAERKTLNQRYLALKEEVKEAEKIRKSVYSILRQEQREQQPHRKQDMER